MNRIIYATIVVMLALAAAASMSLGQDAHALSTTGTSTGTVKEITSEYVLVQSPGDAPRRNWFKWIGDAGAKPDDTIQSAITRIKVGDTVEVTWFENDLRRLESVVLAPPALKPMAKAHPPASTPATVPSMLGATDRTSTASQRVNSLIDGFLATGDRLLQLPTFMLIGIAATVAAGLALAIARLSKNQSRAQTVQRLRLGFSALIFLSAIFVIDRKIARLQEQVSELRIKASADSISLLNSLTKHPSGRQVLLFDPAEVHSALAAQFGEINLHPVIYDEATDIVQARIGNPLAQVYLAVIDLRTPDLHIKLDKALDNTKRLTSEFARDNGCTVAINGEAGASPDPWSGLGIWRGNMMQQGRIILQEDPSVPRPFIFFDRNNRAMFTSAGAAERSLSSNSYNAIWGRFDVILNGALPSTGPLDRQPRTAMAINRDGTRLYLLVVDGRQPRYSMGFTRLEVGQFLKAFGASDGMLCDEGGSSCLYLKQFGGITNIPSDNQGMERPTYTHFGIELGGSSERK